MQSVATGEIPDARTARVTRVVVRPTLVWLPIVIAPVRTTSREQYLEFRDWQISEKGS